MARALVGLRGLSADASAWGNPYVVGVVGRGLEQDGLPDCLEGVQVPPPHQTPPRTFAAAFFHFGLSLHLPKALIFWNF